MDRIEDLRAFVAVIEHGSLTRAAGQLGHSFQSGEPAQTCPQTDGSRERPTIRVRPRSLQRGQRMSLSATRIGASGSRRFTVRSMSMTMSQASHAMTSQ